MNMNWQSSSSDKRRHTCPNKSIMMPQHLRKGHQQKMLSPICPNHSACTNASELTSHLNLKHKFEFTTLCLKRDMLHNTEMPYCRLWFLWREKKIMRYVKDKSQIWHIFSRGDVKDFQQSIVQMIIHFSPEKQTKAWSMFETITKNI